MLCDVTGQISGYSLLILRKKIQHEEFNCSLCLSAEKRFFRRSKSGEILAKNPVVRSKSYNNPLLTPVAEYEMEGAAPNGTGIRRHSVSEMTTCTEMQGYSNLTTITDNGSKNSMTTMKNSQSGESERLSTSSVQCSSSLNVPDQQRGLCYPRDDRNRPFELARDTDLIAIAPTASPENIVDQILESIESDSDGIFIDFGQNCSSSSGYNVDLQWWHLWQAKLIKSNTLFHQWPMVGQRQQTFMRDLDRSANDRQPGR
ncbi:Proline-rich protein 5 [Varanus komodoensis]|nr:Proline-rich protein 5 [Varanus komodoensis]